MQPWKAWGNLDNISLEPLRTFTIQPWEPWKTWEPSGNLEETLREPWQSNLGNLIETFTMSAWEPGPRLLGNLYIIILGTLTTFTWKTWEPCREPWRNLEGLEGTFWEPFGNLEVTLRNLGNLEGTLGTLGTFTWEPLLGNLYLGTLGESVLELLRSAPKPLLWLKTPKLLLWRKIHVSHRDALFMQFQLRCLDWKLWKPLQCILGKFETFTLYPWKAWGNLDNVTLGSLRKPLQCNLGNLENVY